MFELIVFAALLVVLFVALGLPYPPDVVRALDPPLM